MSTKVTVNIYGREYTVAGGDNQEKVLKVAAHVDSKIREVSKLATFLSTTDMAVLAAVNISNDYFATKDELRELKNDNAQMEGDTDHYIQLWEEAKNSFMEYKEENATLQKQKEMLLEKLNAKEKEVERIVKGQGSIQAEIEKGIESKIKEEESRFKELENNFFDLQMENIRIKSELEKLRSGK